MAPPKFDAAADSDQDKWLADLLSRPGPSPDLAQLSQLRAELAQPERRSKRWPVLLVLPLGALAVVAVRAWLGGRSLWRIDLEDLGQRLGLGLAAFSLCAAVAIAAALRRGRNGFGLATAPIRMLSLAITGLITLTPLLLKGTTPQPALAALGGPCAAVVLSAGVIALAAIATIFRHSQPAGAQAKALALGAAAAAWTGIVISLHCPSESTAHLLWGHSAPMLALVGLAAWLLPRQLQP
jgi:hypothetical protein